MRATGIVRRMDDLGRIVIPKEIRKTLRIREGSPLEIFTDNQKGIILKKYAPIKDIRDYSNDVVAALFTNLKMPSFIFDESEVVSFSGITKKQAKAVKIGELNASAKLYNGKEEIDDILEIDAPFVELYVSPIKEDGQIIAYLGIASEKERIGELEIKIVNIQAKFLSTVMSKKEEKLTV